MKKRFLSKVLSIVTTVSLSIGSFAGIGYADPADTSAYGEVLVSDTDSTSWTIAPGNTSRNLAVSPDGSIYAVYNGGTEIRVAKSSDNGKTFQKSVIAATGQYEPEIAVSSSGTVYVVGVESGIGVLVKSTDGGKTFGAPATIGSFMGSAVHMAVDGSYIYVTDTVGSDLFYSSDEGATFNKYAFNEYYAFTDLHVDPQTGDLIVQKDNPSLKYYVSKTHGQTFEKAVIPNRSVFYSVGALSAGNQGQYLFVAGSGSNLERMNLGDNTVATLQGGNNQSSQGRSLSADSYGNVVTGFSNGSSVFFSVSQDLGTTLSSAVEVAATDVANAAINTTNGDILYLYEKSGKIYLKVFQGLLSGYKLYLSNTNLYFNYPAQKKGSVTVTNTSDAALKINEVSVSGDFSIVSNTVASELAPGEGGVIEVQYSPQGPGTSNSKLTLKVDGEPDRVVLLSGISEAAAGSSAPQAADIAANATTDTVTLKNVPAGAEVTVYAADGTTVLGTAKNTADAAADVTVVITAGLSAGEALKVSLTEPDLAESELTDITALNEVTASPAAADISANATSSAVTVKNVPANAVVSVYSEDGITVLGTVTNETGSPADLNIVIASGLADGQIVRIGSQEPGKDQSPLTAVPAAYEPTVAPAAGSLTANATTGVVTASGVPASVTVSVYAEDAVTVLGATYNDTGAPADFNFAVNGLVLGQIVKVSYTEVNKAASAKVEVKAVYEQTVQPLAGNINISATQSTVIVNQVPAGAAASIYNKNNKLLISAVNNTDTAGPLKFTGLALTEGDSISVTLTENKKTESAPISVIITINAADAVNEASKLLEISYSAGESWENVLSALTLAANGSYGTQISWTSSKPEVIEIPAASGSTIKAAVNRGTKDESVVLSAKVSRDGQEKIRTFLLVVTAEGTSKVEDTSNIRNVEVKDQSDVTAQVPVKRINVTAADGTVSKIDKVVFDTAKAQEIISSSVPGYNNTTTVYIDELAGNAADEIAIEVPASTLALLGANGFRLNIQSDYSTVTLNAAELQSMMEDNLDLYFRIVPVHSQSALAAVTPPVPTSFGGQNLKALGQPLEIETNYSGYETTLMIPFVKNGINGALDLNRLAVYIVHSDGDIELSAGTVVYNELKEPVGISFVINKFSTFSVVETSSSLPGSGAPAPAGPVVPGVISDSQTTATEATYSHSSYIQGYEDGTFKPSRAVTRAELAALLARNLGTTAAAAAGFTDVTAQHWAAEYISTVAAAGLMKGDPDGSFKPDRAVTRAEMAVLSARLKALSFDESGAAASAIPDVNKHWAAGAIDAVKAAGLMTGFADGSFAPAKTLSRAEAVTVINRLFERGPLTGVTRPSFSDVPAAHWAYADIEEAAVHHKYMIQNGKEVLAD
ncbi:MULTISPECIES: S-layer homology domain-containing protein [unclassified Paenibacillus]|uniref:S-layer homology domain-containing protein n=1 Tax=unclassified Paenibacillus TaxID=185978 RepID=UPI00240717F6|nr:MULTISPECIES: S-layer homology domain-containing protein [unclassified Paenibacillus]MDF9841561.1 hypothetical protein [Paenibacillus sp. PastF-2]MDF9848327.1 hypothetical protein [Paenibacillus sp. PastM-2]MDF9854720.1 hypothetical protein [Paenibacillus sp. PastF-1]MDH6479990.1 hypothetical protein [Paenibacillus sp. PastH-2]MDH6507424.1 hypothetical protein [Paenibacillus sp. PastM-3]